MNGLIMMGFSPSVRTQGGLGRPVGVGAALTVSVASAATGLHAAPATSRANGRRLKRMVEGF